MGAGAGAAGAAGGAAEAAGGEEAGPYSIWHVSRGLEEL